MSSVFYCPQCGIFDMYYKPNKNPKECVNIRDGYGRPIHHIKCKCGNYLAGYINGFPIKNESDKQYIKDIIRGYGIDGMYIRDHQKWYEYVKDVIDSKEGVKMK